MQTDEYVVYDDIVYRIRAIENKVAYLSEANGDRGPSVPIDKLRLASVGELSCFIHEVRENIKDYEKMITRLKALLPGGRYK